MNETITEARIIELLIEKPQNEYEHGYNGALIKLLKCILNNDSDNSNELPITGTIISLDDCHDAPIPDINNSEQENFRIIALSFINNNLDTFQINRLFRCYITDSKVEFGKTLNSITGFNMSDITIVTNVVWREMKKVTQPETLESSFNKVLKRTSSIFETAFTEISIKSLYNFYNTGYRLQFVKMVKEYSGLGLKEAKDLTDLIWDEMKRIELVNTNTNPIPQE